MKRQDEFKCKGVKFQFSEGHEWKASFKLQPNPDLTYQNWIESNKSKPLESVSLISFNQGSLAERERERETAQIKRKQSMNAYSGGEDPEKIQKQEKAQVLSLRN